VASLYPCANVCVLGDSTIWISWKDIICFSDFGTGDRIVFDMIDEVIDPPLSRSLQMRVLSLAIATAVVSSLILTSESQAQETRRYINPGTVADTATGPYSGGVLVGNTLYLAGTIGLDEDQKVPETVEEEARLVLDDVRQTLGTAGMSMDDLVWVQVFCSDVAHYDAFNRVYRTYFTREFPARAFIGSGTLLFGARFEVQGVAVRR